MTTAEGSIWTLVLMPRDALDDWRHLTEARVGQSLSLGVNYRKRFQWPTSGGFVLRDAEGIVIAAEAGPWVETLDTEDLPAIEVALGADVCRHASSGCGGTVSSQLVFSGDTSVSVGPTQDEEFLLAGHRYFARNVSGGYLLPSSCSDQEHVSTWATWRKP
jgi:hypothetical protein